MAPSVPLAKPVPPVRDEARLSAGWWLLPSFLLGSLIWAVMLNRLLDLI